MLLLGLAEDLEFELGLRVGLVELAQQLELLGRHLEVKSLLHFNY